MYTIQYTLYSIVFILCLNIYVCIFLLKRKSFKRLRLKDSTKTNFKLLLRNFFCYFVFSLGFYLIETKHFAVYEA